MFETDWTAAHWIIVLGLFVVAYAVALVPEALIGWAEGSRGRTISQWALFVFSAGALLIIPGALMRHVEEQSSTWWVILGAVVLAGILGIRAWVADWGILSLVAAGALLAGAVLGGVGDAITRAAASIPMTVGGFLLLVVVIAGGVFLWFRRA